MVEGQMNARRSFIEAVTAGCLIALLGAGSAFGASTPNGFDSRDDDFTPPVIIAPRAVPMPPSGTAEDKISTDGLERGNPLWGISIESLHVTRERPLFSPSRRPPMPVVNAPPVKPVEVAARPPETTFNLLGIVSGTGEGYAVFINNTTHGIVRLKTGEGEDGWVLRSVNGREAVLEKDHRTQVIELPPIMGVSK
jgi:general secretion pathway protein N